MDKTILQDVFTFSYDRLKRYEGEWRLERKKLFPNYVFLESRSHEKLLKHLERYRDIVRALEAADTGGRILLPVCSSEERLLRELCGERHHMEMSKGFIRDGMPVVTEGPLCGKERYIRRIDRHKRTAELEIDFLRRPGRLTVGVEFVSKS